MSETITALCPDGKHRAFHVGHIKHGVRHGYVFAGKRRIYGQLTPGTSCFEPTGKHADLVKGVFEQPAVVDLVSDLEASLAAVDHASTEDVLDDQRADLREEALRQEAETERDDFALARSVD